MVLFLPFFGSRSPDRRPSRLTLFFALALFAVAPAKPSSAQQFVADDAAIAAHGACQLEAWHGLRASWILPACHPIRGLELTADIGFVDDGGGRSAEYVLQAKTILAAPLAEWLTLGLGAGVGFDPLAQVTGRRVQGIFAYLPATLAIAGEAFLLHANLGWHFERHADDGDHDHVHGHAGHHALTWAVRADLPLHARLTAIGELYGENRVEPEFQIGLGAALLPDRVQAFLSWGGHTARGFRGPGWVLGMAWTPPPFF